MIFKAFIFITLKNKYQDYPNPIIKPTHIIVRFYNESDIVFKPLTHSALGFLIFSGILVFSLTIASINRIIYITGIFMKLLK